MYVFARVIDRSLVSVFQHVCEAVHVYLVCILRPSETQMSTSVLEMFCFFERALSKYCVYTVAR